MSFFVGAIASDGATIARVGGSGDIVALALELCHKIAIAIDGESVVGICGDLVAILSPSHKGVVSSWSGMNGAGLALLEGAATRNSTSIGWIGRHTDGVVLRLCLEVGHQGAVAIHREGIIGLR